MNTIFGCWFGLTRDRRALGAGLLLGATTTLATFASTSKREKGENDRPFEWR